jgi:hypothetical protein
MHTAGFQGLGPRWGPHARLRWVIIGPAMLTRAMLGHANPMDCPRAHGKGVDCASAHRCLRAPVNTRSTGPQGAPAPGGACPQAFHTLGLRLETAARSPQGALVFLISISSKLCRLV